MRGEDNRIGGRARPHPNHYVAGADFVGVINLYRKWNGTFTYPPNKQDEDTLKLLCSLGPKKKARRTAVVNIGLRF